MRDRPQTPSVTRPILDRTAVRRMFARAGDGEPEFARAMTIARDALFHRLDDIRIVPDRILDLGAGTGAAALELGRRYRAAEIVCIDPVVTLLESARTGRSSGVSTQRVVAGEAERLPLTSNSVDLVFSNVAMPWFDPLDAALAECMRAMRPGGLLLLSTLGSGTLRELYTAWSGRTGSTRMYALDDMHVLGDALVRAGFADVVMDVERIRFPAPDFRELCRILGRSGGANVMMSRRRSLTATGTFRAAATRYESLRDSDGVISVGVEFVFGHGWAPDDLERGQTGVVPRVHWTRNSQSRT